MYRGASLVGGPAVHTFTRWSIVGSVLLARRNHHSRAAGRPAGESRRHRLLVLDHLRQDVETVRHQHVRVLGHRVGQLAIGLGGSVGRLLLLLGDARVRDLRLEGIDASLRLVVEVHDRDDDVLHVDVVADLGLQQLGDCLGQDVLAGRDGVALVVRGQGVVVLEHRVERGAQFTGDETVADVREVLVVPEQAVGRPRLDPPPDGVVHARDALVGDAHAGARGGVLRVGASMAVRLDGAVQLGDLVPRSDEVEAVVQRAHEPAERGDHTNVLGGNDRVRAKAEQEHRQGGEPHEDPLDCGHGPVEVPSTPLRQLLATPGTPVVVAVVVARTPRCGLAPLTGLGRRIRGDLVSLAAEHPPGDESDGSKDCHPNRPQQSSRHCMPPTMLTNW